MLAYTVTPIVAFLSLVKGKVNDEKVEELFGKKHSLIILFISMTLASLQNFIVYLPTVNPKGLPMGADILHYERFLRKVIRKGPWEAIRISPARSLYLLLLYVAWLYLRPPTKELVQLMPSVMLPLIVVTSYFMVKKLTESWTIAALSSLFLATSPQVTITIFGSFQANMLALTIMYGIIGMYYSKSKVTPILSLIGSAAMQFVHPWTAIHMLAFFTVLMISSKKFRHRYSLITFLAIAIGILLGDRLKVLLVGGEAETVITVTGHYTSATIARPLENLSAYWWNLHRVISSYCRGYMNYPLVLLTLYIYVKQVPKEVKYFSASWMLTLIFMYISPYFYIARLMLTIPLQVPLAIAVYKTDNNLIIFSALVASISYSLLCIVNLVTM